MPPPYTLTVAPLTGLLLLFTVKVTKVAIPLVTLEGDALTLRVCWPTAENVLLPEVKPVLEAVAVIVPGPAEFTCMIAIPFWFVTPFPLAAPVSVTVASLMKLLPLFTVNVTKVGVAAVIDEEDEETDRDCVPVEVIVLDPLTNPVLLTDIVMVPVVCGVTKMIVLPSGLVIPSPVAAPLMLIPASATGELPVVTVNVTYTGTLTMRVLWLDDTASTC